MFINFNEMLVNLDDISYIYKQRLDGKYLVGMRFMNDSDNNSIHEWFVSEQEMNKRYNDIYVKLHNKDLICL